MKPILTLILITSIYFNSFSQTFSSTSFGASIGLSLSIGTHFNRFGISLQGYYTNDFSQLNAAIRGYYSFQNLGPSKRYLELAPSIGATISYGKKDTETNPFISPISNQTRRKYSIGYAYNFYWNRISTTQSTGTVSLQFGKFQFIMENDYFAFATKDQFRTGSFLVQYRYKDFQFGINSTLWTGATGERIADPAFPSRLGYLDMSKSLYGNISHGLLSLQVEYAFPHGQLLRANVGIDAEQVRNTIQNRLLHDLIFTPEKWHLANNAHIPMVDSEGKMYLHQPGQKIRKAKFYGNIFLNPGVFY